MRGALILIAVLVMTVVMAACQGDSTSEPSPAASPVATPEITTPPVQTPTSPAAETPTPSEAETPPVVGSPSPTVACAAGSGERFREAQAEADFTLYCPTFLPEGFQMESAPGVIVPPGGATTGEVDATFTNPDKGASIMLFQGNLGASFLSSLTDLAAAEGIAPQTAAYGEIQGTLYAPLATIPGVSVGAFVVANLPDGTRHVLQTEEVDIDGVRSIAAGMRPLSP